MSRVAPITGQFDVATEHKSVSCGPMLEEGCAALVVACERAPSGQAEYAADRSQTFDVADPEHAFNPQDDLLFPIAPDA
jgi:hypothetical protein